MVGEHNDHDDNDDDDHYDHETGRAASWGVCVWVAGSREHRRVVFPPGGSDFTLDARALDIRDRMLDIRDRMLDYLLCAFFVGVEVVDGGRFREHTPHMHAHTHTSGGGGLAHTEFTAGGGLYAKSPAKRRTT